MTEEFNRGTHQMRLDEDGVWRCRMCRTDERLVGLDYCLNLERSYTTRTIRFGVPDMPAEVERARCGFPWCSVCQRPSHAPGMGQGLRHNRAEFPGYWPAHEDPYDHEVSHRDWFEVSP